MIVERRVYKTRPYCDQAAADFVKETFGVFGYPITHHVYLPISGPSSVVYHELEFKDWVEREQMWADFFALPQMPEWLEKWKDLTIPGGNIEFSNLME